MGVAVVVRFHMLTQSHFVQRLEKSDTFVARYFSETFLKERMGKSQQTGVSSVTFCGHCKQRVNFGKRNRYCLLLWIDQKENKEDNQTWLSHASPGLAFLSFLL